MKVKMLATRIGGVNNGFGNLTMTYTEGEVYLNPPPEEVEVWLEGGFAEVIAEPDETKPAEPEMAIEPMPEEAPVPVYSSKDAEIESLIRPHKKAKRK